MEEQLALCASWKVDVFIWQCAQYKGLTGGSVRCQVALGGFQLTHPQQPGKAENEPSFQKESNVDFSTGTFNGNAH